MPPSPRSTRWQMTVYEGQYYLFDGPYPDGVKEWGWQDEICPKTGKKHRQGYLQTVQMTSYLVRKRLPGVHIEVARDWIALLKQCQKEETRDLSGTMVVGKPRRILAFYEALENVARASKDFLTTLDAERFSVLTRDNKLCEEQQWYGVRKLLEDHKEDISLYSNPQLFRAWKGTSAFWIKNVST